jgi:hypothetical protein
MASRTLRDVLVSVRSKNAGPFTVTVDLFFADLETFLSIVDARVIDRARVAVLYGVEPADVHVHEFQPALAIKISMPRLVPGGAPGDRDVAGGQQYAPLLDLAV